MLGDRSYRPFTPMPSEHMTTIRALTHSGYFHPDEVTAYAILRQADKQVDGSFVRSRARL